MLSTSRKVHITAQKFFEAVLQKLTNGREHVECEDSVNINYKCEKIIL